MSRSEALRDLALLYRELEKETDRLDRVHRERLQCKRGCSRCCEDDLTVFDIEAENILTANASLLESELPHPKGACAFLDAEGACRVYEQRPYVCRTHGYPLRWVEELEGGMMGERRDICTLNVTPAPIEELPESDCWFIGPFEGELAHLQSKAFDGRMTRTSLRSLFKKSPSAESAPR